MRLGFARWVSATPSGGNRYDAELLAGLRRLGLALQVITAPADPSDDPAIRAALAAAFPRERRWLVDGIIAGAAPDLITAAVAAGTTIVIVVHHFDPERSARDAAAMRAASGVLCTSHWAAAELRRRYGIDGAVVAAPGVDQAPIAPGSRDTTSPRILSVGTLSPIKDQIGLVAALARVADRAWTARIVGDDTAEPAYAAAVREAIDAAGLADRSTVTGALAGAELEAEWSAADLLVQTSRSETYGLVVLEALARGIPAIVTSGTGLVEALGAGREPDDPWAGARVPAGRPDELAGFLRTWLGSDALAQGWRAAATAQRRRLPDWSAPAATVARWLGTGDGSGPTVGHDHQ